MITRLSDEAGAYDEISILQIKVEMGLPCFDFLLEQSQYVRKEVGDELHEQILRSKEYDDLLKANLETWHDVDKARIDAIKASQVWRNNDKRYLAKKALQERFFPKTTFTEVKNR